MESNELAKEIEIVQSNIHAIDIKIENLNNRTGQHSKNWEKIFDAIWKVSLMLIAGYILYKLGIQSPPLS